MRSRSWLRLFVPLLLVSLASVAGAEPKPVPSAGVGFTVGGREFAGEKLAKAAVDSHVIYGGAGSGEGTFQDVSGLAGDLQGWTTVDLTDDGTDAVGDFGRARIRFQDIDPCTGNTTPLMAFVDDGTPPNNRPGQSTGGETSTTWSYGFTGGWVVNHSGGLSTTGRSLHNEVQSPSISWDDASTTSDDHITGGLLLRYSVWEHLPRENGIFHTWRVRSFPDPVGGGWSEWRDRGFVYFSDEPAWSRREVDLSDLIVAGAQKVQVALGVIDLASDMGLFGNDSTPGPCFDDVSLVKYERRGPMLVVKDIDRFHDGFPHAGVAFDSLNPGNQATRLDTGRDINTLGAQIVTADSMVVRAVAITPGSELQRPPTLTWFLRVNDLFDPVRVLPTGATEVVPGVWTGFVTGTPVSARVGLEDLYAFDLPDGPPRNTALIVEPPEDPLFFPGDRLYFFLSAIDDNGDEGFWFQDPSGFDPTEDGGLCGKRPPRLAYKPSPTQGDPRDPEEPEKPDPVEPIDSLPGLWDVGFGKGSAIAGAADAVQIDAEKTRTSLPSGIHHPDLLIWNDASDWKELAYAVQSLGQLGLLPGRDFDVYSTYGAGIGSSNGLGANAGRGATAAQIQEYEVLLYLAGRSGPPLISDGTNAGLNDKSDDVGLLQDWRAQPGPRAVIYFADRIASAMFEQGSLAYDHLLFDQGVLLVDDDRSDELGGQEFAIVQPSSAQADFLTTFAVDQTLCMLGPAGDAVVPFGGASSPHLFTDANGATIFGLSPSVVYERNVNVGGTVYPRIDITFPFSFHRVRDVLDLPPDSEGRSARSLLLGEALLKAGLPVDPGSATTTPSQHAKVRVSAPSPNPFNPSTTLWLERGTEAAWAEVTLHDLRGRRLRTLFAQALEPGRTPVIWDGRDERGRTVASGVYLVKVVAEGDTEVFKAVLVK